MARAVTIALLVALAVVAAASAKRRSFSFKFQPLAPRPRFRETGSGGACNHQDFSVETSEPSKYGLYSGRGSMRVAASGGVAHAAIRTRGKTYKHRTQAAAAIGIEIPIFSQTETTPQV